MPDTTTGIDQILAAVAAEIEALAPLAAELTDRIWRYAEPGFSEEKSAEALCEVLRAEGFEVETGQSGMPTAFVARWGTEGPSIGLLCEYDATPGEKQGAHPAPHPEAARYAGFTDLHNGIGTASAIAAIAIVRVLKAEGIAGRVTCFGTPAEKLCVGKPFMARDGHFDGIDAFIAWHPRPYSTVEWDTGPGMQQGEIFDFHGKSAYSARPWTGTNALDSVTLMNVIMQFMREHFPRADGVTLTEMVSRGGEHLTSIPGHAQIWYIHRATTRAAIERTSDVLDRAATAAVTAIGGSFEKRVVSATRPWLPNHALGALCQRNLEKAGGPRFGPEARDFAAKVLAELGREPDPEPFDETVTSHLDGVTIDFAGGADDVNEFCWHAPTARIYVAHGLRTTAIPNWARAAFCHGETAAPTVVAAARAIAYSTLDLIGDPETLAEATAEWKQRRDAAGAPSPHIPADVMPPCDAKSAPPYMQAFRLHRLDHPID